MKLRDKTRDPREMYKESICGEYSSAWMDDGIIHDIGDGLEAYIWIAVIVPQESMAAVYARLSKLCREIAQECGVKELHCSDLYMGRNGYAGLGPERKLYYLESLRALMRTHKLPVVHFMITKKQFDESEEIAELLKLDNIGMDLSDPRKFAFFMLYHELLKYLRNNQATCGKGVRCFMDQGLFPPLLNVFWPATTKEDDELIHRNMCVSVPSDEYLPIQLADFIAFLAVRSERMASRTDISPMDFQVMMMTSSIYNNLVDQSNRKIMGLIPEINKIGKSRYRKLL